MPCAGRVGTCLPRPRHGQAFTRSRRQHASPHPRTHLESRKMRQSRRASPTCVWKRAPQEGRKSRSRSRLCGRGGAAAASRCLQSRERQGRHRLREGTRIHTGLGFRGGAEPQCHSNWGAGQGYAGAGTPPGCCSPALLPAQLDSRGGEQGRCPRCQPRRLRRRAAEDWRRRRRRRHRTGPAQIYAVPRLHAITGGTARHREQGCHSPGARGGAADNLQQCLGTQKCAWPHSWWPLRQATTARQETFSCEVEACRGTRGAGGNSSGGHSSHTNQPRARSHQAASPVAKSSSVSLPRLQGLRGSGPPGRVRIAAVLRISRAPAATLYEGAVGQCTTGRGLSGCRGCSSRGWRWGHANIEGNGDLRGSCAFKCCTGGPLEACGGWLGGELVGAGAKSYPYLSP